MSITIKGLIKNNELITVDISEDMTKREILSLKRQPFFYK